MKRHVLIEKHNNLEIYQHSAGKYRVVYREDNTVYSATRADCSPGVFAGVRYALANDGGLEYVARGLSLRYARLQFGALMLEPWNSPKIDSIPLDDPTWLRYECVDVFYGYSLIVDNDRDVGYFMNQLSESRIASGYVSPAPIGGGIIGDCRIREFSPKTGAINEYWRLAVPLANTIRRCGYTARQLENRAGWQIKDEIEKRDRRKEALGVFLRHLLKNQQGGE